MIGKLFSETFKKVAINTVPISLLTIIVGIIYNLFYLEDISTYKTGALYFLNIVLIIISATVLALTAFNNIIRDLFMDRSYKYYSLPYSKSAIILSKAIPTSMLLSIIIVLLLMPSDIAAVVNSALHYDFSYEYISMLFEDFLNYFSIVFLAFMVFVLAAVISKSFNSKNSTLNFSITVIIAVLFNAVIYSGHSKLVSIIVDKYISYFAPYGQEAFENDALRIEIINNMPFIIRNFRYILTYTLILISVIEIIGVLIAIKKLANKKFNVL